MRHFRALSGQPKMMRNRVAVERYEILIEETENKIEGMKNSPYYNG